MENENTIQSDVFHTPKFQEKGDPITQRWYFGLSSLETERLSEPAKWDAAWAQEGPAGVGHDVADDDEVAGAHPEALEGHRQPRRGPGPIGGGGRHRWGRCGIVFVFESSE